MKKTRVLIIGSGPAGYTAAIYTARANLSPLMVSGYDMGGQLMITTDVENYPGFEQILGPELMERMKCQSQRLGVEILNDMVKTLNLKTYPFIAKTDLGEEIEAESVILATGAKAKWLGLESEKAYLGFGVSGCATCDGFFFKQKDVAVIGGGNTALEEALYLTHHASKVYLIHRRDQFRGEKILQDRVFKNPKIEILWNQTLGEVLGETAPMRKVTHINLKNTLTSQLTTLSVEGVFIAIGHTPQNELVQGTLDLDPEGYVITEPGTAKTSLLGVFAAGDVQDKLYRQAVTAAGQGCMAALEAERFLSSKRESS